MDKLTELLLEITNKKNEQFFQVSTYLLSKERESWRLLFDKLKESNLLLLKENTQLNQKLKTSETRAEKIKDLEEYNKNLISQVDTFKKNETDLTKQNNQTKKINQTLKTENENLKLTLDDKTKIQDSLNQNIDKLSKQIKTLENEKIDLNGALSNSNITIEAKNREIERLQLRVAEFSTQKTGVIPVSNPKEVENLKQQIETLNSEKEQFQKNLLDQAKTFIEQEQEKFKKQCENQITEISKRAQDTDLQNNELDIRMKELKSSLSNNEQANLFFKTALKNCLYIIQQYKENTQCIDRTFPINETNYWKYTAFLFFEYVKIYHGTKDNELVKVDPSTTIDNFDPTKIDFNKTFFEKILFPEANKYLFDTILTIPKANYQYYVAKKYTSKFLLTKPLPTQFLVDKYLNGNAGTLKDSFLRSLYFINNIHKKISQINISNIQEV